MLSRHVVLALALGERNHGHARLVDERVDAANERSAHRRHQGGGGKRVAPVETEEGDHSPFILQPRDVHVEVHSIDALQLQCHVLVDDFRDRSW